MSLRSMLRNWIFGPPLPAAEDETPRPKLLDFSWSTHQLRQSPAVFDALVKQIQAAAPRPVEGGGWAMDSSGDTAAKIKALEAATVGDALFSWYGSQRFIGFQLAAVIAQHWLVDKACSMPARDAIRQGFIVGLEGKETDAAELAAINKANRRLKLNYHMQQFIRMGRVFGIRIAIFKVESTDPKYYERPFNPDAVTPGSYKGIVQVDPYWCTPELNLAAVSDPSSEEFYEPTWWRINNKRYHKSHLAIFRTSTPADILKPSYLYGGVSVPQRIMERVYAAERTANEGPQLAMTKRLTVWATDIGELLSNQTKFLEHMANFTAFRDNYGTKIIDGTDKMETHDTALTDLDETIMTQYQLVAAAAQVPATKLLGTTPKGFNATGEYEEASYHEELETIQENDLTPFVERHLELVTRSEIEPKFGAAPGTLHATVEWNPLDSPTGKERAETNKLKAERDEALIRAGAIDGEDVRNRIRADRESDYFGITADLPQDDLEAATEALEEYANGGEPGAADDPLTAATAALTGGGGDPLAEATAALQDG